VSHFLLRTTQCYARRCYVGLKSLKSLNLTNVYPNNNKNKNNKKKKKNNKVKSKPLELRSRVKKVTVQMLSKCQYRKTGPKILNKVKRASHFVKKIVACPHRLPKLPESTHRKQAIPNKGSLFYSHCGFSCGKNATNFGVNLCKRLRRRSRPSQQKKVDHGNHKLIIVRETVINPIPKTINTRLPLSNPIM
jgi:hypothetical protein